MDADWGSDVATRRSTSGVIVFLAGGPVIFRSKRQHSVALSSAEAEYMALSSCSQDVIWLRQLLDELGVHIKDATTVEVDNQAAIAMAQRAGYQSRAKHIDLRVHFVRDAVARGDIKLQYVPTNDQLADFLTKPLPAPRLLDLRERANVRAVRAEGE